MVMGRPPVTVWSDTDHSGPIIITTVLTLVYWLAPGIGQQLISFGRRGSLSGPDLFFVASMVRRSNPSKRYRADHPLDPRLRTIADTLDRVRAWTGKVEHGVAYRRRSGLSTGTIPVSIAAGFHAIRSHTPQLYHASNILYILVLGAAKCSATCSVISLTVPDRGSIRRAPARHKMVFALATALVIVWTTGSVVALAVQCEPNSTGSPQISTCDGTLETWVGIVVSDAVTDLVIAAFGASIIWPTKARFQLKLMWYTPFCIRLCVIALSGSRLATFDPANLCQDPTIAIWLCIVITQCQIFVTLVAAGFPALKKTVLDLVTNFGISEDSQDRSRFPTGYILGPLRSKTKRSRPEQSSTSFTPYNAGARSNVAVKAGENRAPSDDDSSQKGIMRRDEYDVMTTIVDPIESHVR